MEDRDLLTTSAACEFLGVHQGTLTKLIEAGELVPIVIDTESLLSMEGLVELKSKREVARKAAVQELLELGEDE
jgi:predicted site-specific integrase-resolvase